METITSSGSREFTSGTRPNNKTISPSARMISRSGVRGLNFTNRSNFVWGARASRAPCLASRQIHSVSPSARRQRLRPGRSRSPFQISDAVSRMISRSGVRGLNFTNRSNFVWGARASRAPYLASRQIHSVSPSARRQRLRPGRSRSPFQISDAVSRMISCNGVSGLNCTDRSNFFTSGLRRRMSSKPGA
jgi:hypothetical protein